MQKNLYRAQPLLSHVVEGGYCIGCGGCAALTGSPLSMHKTSFGLYQPTLDATHQETSEGIDVGMVCPFYAAEDEDSIGARLFADGASHDKRLGYYRAVYAGSVRENNFRRDGSSGGLVTWILTSLLDRGLVDGVIHVGGSEAGADTSAIFGYQISLDVAAVAQRAKSRYYPAEFSGVAQLIRKNPGRYVFVGVPCFVKAMRLLAAQDELIADRLAYCIAIFCGHLKSSAFTDAIGWQLGLTPGTLTNIDFRHKRKHEPANRYGVKVRDSNGMTREAASRDLYGSDWGLGFFKPKACDFCDDIAGEVADVSCGDAWLPEYVKDSRGTNIVVVRNPQIADLIQKGMNSGLLNMDPLGPEDVYRSQAGNYRHRREGLAYRLWLAEQRGEWHPVKRVKPQQDHLSEQRKAIYRARSELSARSHETFSRAAKRGCFRDFKHAMDPLVAKYYRINGTYLRYCVKEALRYVRNLKRIFK